MNNSALSVVKDRSHRPGAAPLRAEGRAKFSFRKILHNPLKRLDSDEIVRDLFDIKDLSGR